MRLIDADALKEWIENWFTKNRFYHPYAKNNNIPITELYDILEQMPSAQPEKICVAHITLTDEQVQEAVEKAKRGILVAQPERKRGKWMLADVHESTHKAMLCNKCNVAYDMTIAGGMFNFCPNCGADMRGDSDEA